MGEQIKITALKIALQQSEQLRKQQGHYIKRLRVLLRRTSEILRSRAEVTTGQKLLFLEEIEKALDLNGAN
jgi:hypothetical protein